MLRITPHSGGLSGKQHESCPAAQTLIITVTGAVVDQNAGTGDDLFNVPVLATDSAGVTDLVGDSWDISTSDDVLFDLNPGNDAEIFT